MKKLSFVLAFAALLSISSFAKGKSPKKVTASFPVEFVTSCGTWTGTGDCGSLNVVDCASFLNSVGDFLESLCE